MALRPSYVHNYTKHPSIMSSSTQMTLIPSNVHNNTQTTSNQGFLFPNDLNTVRICIVALNNIKYGPFQLK